MNDMTNMKSETLTIGRREGGKRITVGQVSYTRPTLEALLAAGDEGRTFLDSCLLASCERRIRSNVDSATGAYNAGYTPPSTVQEWLTPTERTGGAEALQATASLLRKLAEYLVGAGKSQAVADQVVKLLRARSSLAAQPESMRQRLESVLAGFAGSAELEPMELSQLEAIGAALTADAIDLADELGDL